MPDDLVSFIAVNRWLADMMIVTESRAVVMGGNNGGLKELALIAFDKCF